MKKFSLSLAAVCGLVLAGVSAAFAGPTDYQATGPVLAVTDSTITIQHGKEKWELGKDAATKGATDLKVGDKVTVHYTMTATTVEAKPAAPAKATAAKKDTKKAAATSATNSADAPTSANPGDKPAAEAAPGSSPTAH